VGDGRDPTGPRVREEEEERMFSTPWMVLPPLEIPSSVAIELTLAAA
jgi:hypothetical protein